MSSITSRTIVFVTGAFVTHHGWEPWKKYFEDKGYTTHNPPWPYKDGTVEELRAKHPSGNVELATMKLGTVVDSYATFISALPETPVIIGHSLGGLMTQILINRGLGAAGVAIHPVPPLGIIPYEFSFLKGGWRSLGFFTSVKKTYLMSFKTWQYAFVNGMSPEDQQKAWNENCIPESKTVARGGLTKDAKVDFKKAHAPLLITSGDKDHIIPAHLNKRNFKRYKQNGSVTEYKEFPGRNHFVVGQPTWAEDAAYIHNWLQQQ